MAKLFRMNENRPAFYKSEMIDQYENDFRQFPPMNHIGYSMSYITYELKQTALHRRVDHVDMLLARQKLEHYLDQYVKKCGGDRRAYQEGLEKIWPNLEQRMLKHPAVYKYVMDFATQSPSLLNFMSWVPCSETMENAFGYGYNIAEEYGPLSPADVAFYWSLREPVLSGIRQRVCYAQGEIGRLMQPILRGERKEKLRILFVGAGRAPELRRWGYPTEFLLQQEVVAVDEDKGVWSNIDFLFQQVHGKTVKELGIRYYNMSFSEFMRNGNWNGYFDLIIANGFMSYYQDEMQTLHMLRGLRSLLKVGGRLVMDLQLLHVSLLRCKFALDWNTNPPLSPDVTDKGAEKRIREACQKVGFDVCDAQLLRTDLRPKSPKIGMVFTLERPGDWAD